jgi:hypothetical protein
MLVAGLAGGVLDKDECVNSEGAGAGVMISSCVVALALALMVLVLPAKPGSPEWVTVFTDIFANIRTVLECISGQDVTRLEEDVTRKRIRWRRCKMI